MSTRQVFNSQNDKQIKCQADKCLTHKMTSKINVKQTNCHADTMPN